ncbi:MAG: IS630 family transposase, partial [Clostridia bacterium]|nr:IS630 family transposase [Clostridia bacterium]MCX7745913.1 IS630 family transposase [Clostridia bacterium]MCX7746202.1 IS630 family transposase [Clostridia bacterium]
MRREVATWQFHRNLQGATVKWQFTTEDARIKLKSLYPKI